MDDWTIRCRVYDGAREQLLLGDGPPLNELAVSVFAAVISWQAGNCELWPGGGVMVRALARDTKGRGFDCRPFHFQVTTLGKLSAQMCFCHQAVYFVPVQGR